MGTDSDFTPSTLAGSDIDAFNSGEHTGAADTRAPSVRSLAETQMTPESFKFDSSQQSTSFNSTTAGREACDVVGNYKVVGVLGRGGFGTVYRGRDERLGRDVAIKFLTDTRDDRMLKLFEREARVIAALGKHPAVVQIFEWGELDGCPYFVLEMMDRSASALMEDHPDGLEPGLALYIVAECAGALSYAHERGILHRDLKPANILLDEGGLRPKLADFGLARFRTGKVDELTISGTVSGSPPYMSPEQAAGETLDQRSDIYSLGVTLYKLLSGHLPFEGLTAVEIMARIRSGDHPPITVHRPQLPQSLAAVVEKAFAHAPEDRYQTAESFEQDLRRELSLLRGEQPAAPRRSRQHSRQARKLFYVAGGVALALVGVVSGTLLLDRAGVPVGNTAFAEARADMESGKYAEAESTYRTLLAETPGDSQNGYGLTMALLQQGKLDDAETVAKALPEGDKLAREALGAVSATRDPAALDTLQEDALTPYLRLQRAKLRLSKQQYDEVLKDIGTPEADKFQFTWQYVEAMQALGQAQYKLGQYGEAKQVFETAMAAAGTQQKSVLAAYLKQTSNRLDSARRAETLQRAQELRAMLDKGYQAPKPEDLWSSRPLTYFVLPPEVPAGAMEATDSGLSDLFPDLLAEALSDTPMQLVDREVINDVLAEQELAATVGKDGGLALQQVLGARLILRPKFRVLKGTESVVVDVVDAERTSKLVVKAGDLSKQTDVNALMQDAATRVWEKVRQAYPVQGRLYALKGVATLNVGQNVGAQAGMRFRVMTSMSGQPLPNLEPAILSTTSEASVLSINDDLASRLPKSLDSAWFVTQVTGDTLSPPAEPAQGSS